MKRTTTETLCDRCERIVPDGASIGMSVDALGEAISFSDLCPKCQGVCRDHLRRLAGLATLRHRGPPAEVPAREPAAALAPPEPPKAAGDAPEVAGLREALRGLLRDRPAACGRRGIHSAHGIARGGQGWLRTTLAAVQEEIAREDAEALPPTDHSSRPAPDPGLFGED